MSSKDFVTSLAFRTVAKGYRLNRNQSLAVFNAYATSIEDNPAENYKLMLRLQQRYDDIIKPMLTNEELNNA